ncbi:MAG: hypothetical protein ABW080_09595 [Candidatus Thiodiazotropha sp.]
MDADEEIENCITELLPRIKAGDLEATYDASRYYHTLAMTRLSWASFNEFERLLVIAKNGGYPEAIEWHKNLEILKHGFSKRVERRSKT